MDRHQINLASVKKKTTNPPLTSLDLSGLNLTNVPLNLFSTRRSQTQSSSSQGPGSLLEQGPWSLQERSTSRISLDSTNQRKRRKTRRERSQRKIEGRNNISPKDLKALARNLKQNESNIRNEVEYIRDNDRQSIRKSPKHSELVSDDKKDLLHDIKSANIKCRLSKTLEGEHNYHFTTSVNPIAQLTSAKLVKKSCQADEQKKSIWKSLTSELELKLKERAEQKKLKDFEPNKKILPTISFKFKDSSWLLKNVSLKTKDSFDLIPENSPSISSTAVKVIKPSFQRASVITEIPQAPPLPIKSFKQIKTLPEDCFSLVSPRTPDDIENKTSDVSFSAGSCSLPSNLKDFSSDDRDSPIPDVGHQIADNFVIGKYHNGLKTKRHLKEKRARNKTVGFGLGFDEQIEQIPLKKDLKYFSLPPNARQKRPKTKQCPRKLSSQTVYNFDSETNSEGETLNRISSIPQKITKSNNKEIQAVKLSHNRLNEFPQTLFKLPFLLKIDLSWNKIQKLPKNLSLLSNLLILNLSHNELCDVDVNQLKKLSTLNLSFNSLKRLPVISQGKALKFLNLSCNQIWNISLPVDPSESSLEEELMDRNIDRGHPSKAEEDPVVLNLKNNRIAGAVTLASFQHVTELDVSDNGITSLDISSLAALRSLTCSNNAIVTVSLHGATLQSLVADNNRVSCIRVKNHPRNLKYFTFSRNCIGSVPPWLVSCNLLQHLDVSHNNLTSLPAYVTSGHLIYLKCLAANHNQLQALSSSDGIPESSMTVNERKRRSNLEILLLHHNFIETFSSNFFYNFLRLRVLNISSNRLEEFPDTSSTSRVDICPNLQELYAANNKIQDLTPLQICQSLRILHVPYNEIDFFPECLTWAWELLEDLVLSGNLISSLPSGISRLPRLNILKIHLNPIKSLPKLSHLNSLKVIDASHCRLGRIEFEAVVSPSLSTLDIASNPSMKIDRQQFSKCRSRRAVSMVNTATDKGRSFPLQDTSAAAHAEEDLSSSESDAGTISSDSLKSQGQGLGGREYRINETSPKLPWSIGFCEASGKNQGLTLGQLRLPDYEEGGNIGLVAMADGGTNFEIANRLLSLFPKTLRQEKLCCPDITDALKYTLLSCLRKLMLQDGSLPQAFCSAYFELESGKQADEFHSRRSVRNPITPERTGTSLRLCCFGEIKAVVTSVDGPPLVVSSLASQNIEEAKENFQSNGRLKRGVQTTLPDPHTTLVRLGHHHRSLVIGSGSLWEAVQPDEVNEVCKKINDPALVAKRLLTLAQSYGCKKALSVLVTFLPTGSVRNSYQYSSLSAKNMNYKEKSPSQAPNTMSKTKTKKTDNSKFTSKYSLGISNKRHNQIEQSEKIRYPPSGQSDPEDAPTNVEKILDNTSAKIIMDTYATVQKPPKRQAPVPSAKPLQYYHYPPPISPSKPNCSRQVPQLQQRSSTLKTLGASADMSFHTDILSLEQIPPPVGFGDTDDESSGSDSGFSGHSDSKEIVAQSGVSSDHVSEEQYKSWEYLLTKNADVLFTRELDSLNGKKVNGSISSASVPNLSIVSDEERKEPRFNNDGNSSESKFATITSMVSATSSHFQRNIIRKSRFARGAVKLLQNKLNLNHTLKINDNNPHKLRSATQESFRRFGSLQNLEQYQNSDTKTEEQSNFEMREKFDTMELETRMKHYWCNDSGVTCF